MTIISSVNAMLGRLRMFPLWCVLIFAAFAVSLPSYTPLIQPDSYGYLNFSVTRTALYPAFLQILLGLGLDQLWITHVQLVLFCIALMILIPALLRARVPRFAIVAFVVALGANSYFSTFHRTILTESLFGTLAMIGVAFWIDYLRTGKAVALAWTGLFLGLAIGVRPAGLPLAPMLALSVLLKWRARDVSLLVLGTALIIPLAAGPVTERVIYRLKHAEVSDSLLNYLLIGRGSMVIRQDTSFSGPHADTLNRLGKKLYDSYVPVHAFLAEAPAGAVPGLAAAYESIGQFQVLRDEISEVAIKLSVPNGKLYAEIGSQAIKSNIPGFLRMTLIHYVGQWSVASLTFPPTSRALNAYTSTANVPFSKLLSDAMLRPPEKLSSYVIYPAFLAAGVVTLILSLVLVAMLLRPSLVMGERGMALQMAALFGASCQTYTLFLSLVDVSTPRFILAYYPQLLLVGIFLMLALWPQLLRDEPSR